MVAFLSTHKRKIELLLRAFIFVDLIILLLIFLHSRLDVQFPFPLPGKRLNNPFMYLLIAVFLVGTLNSEWRDKWLNRLQQTVTGPSQRFLFFGSLILIGSFLEVMHFLYPDALYWNLNVEQGNGTYFSTMLLYLLGLIILVIYREEGKEGSQYQQRWLWLLVASVYFYLALDECLAIHEQFIMFFQDLNPDAKVFHFVHEWLWVYVPFVVVVVIFFARFFLWRFKNELSVMVTLFIALSLWVTVIFYEGLAKNIIDPMGHGILLIGIEEGSEMLGAVLFMIGFSKHLQRSQKFAPCDHIQKENIARRRGGAEEE